MYLFVTLQVCSAQSTFRGVSERGKICSLIAVLKMNGYCTLLYKLICIAKWAKYIVCINISCDKRDNFITIVLLPLRMAEESPPYYYSLAHLAADYHFHSVS